MAEDAALTTRLYAGPFPALEEKLLSRLPDPSGRPPGREEVLLVPSNELREHLLRRLAGRWDGSAAGLDVMTLYDFALRLLKHRGAFPRDLPPAQMAAALSAAAAEVYAKGEGDFAPIAATPGFLPCLLRTLADLEEGWLGRETFRAAERQARQEGDGAKAARWAEWRRLLAAVERKIRAAGGMSRRRIFQEAVAGFEQPGYPFRAVLYGFYDFTRLQWTLVDALLGSGLLDEVYFPGLFGEGGTFSPAFAYAYISWDRLLRAFEGNVEVLASPASPGIDAVRERIFSPRPLAVPAPVPFQVLSAPHEEGEMRLAARQVRRWLDADPDGEILLLSRRFEQEAVSAWERSAGEYGIRTVERLHVPLSSVPPVRVLVQMIEAAEEDFPRRKVIDILSSPYRRHASGGDAVPPRPDLWDVLSRELLVVSGADWETRLVRPRLHEPDDEDEEARREREAQLALLRGEMQALRESLRPVREAGGYAALAGRLRSLLVADFRIVDDDSPEAERDRRAVSALLSLLDDIERIPEREVPWPGSSKALAWFRTLLTEQPLFLGAKGGMRVPGAVVAGDLFSLRGVTADRVLFLTANEDVVPAQLSEDPLLPDEDRETLNRLARQPGLPDALALRRRNAAEEKLLFSLPAAQARKDLAFSVLRADAGGAAKRPSRYLLHLLSQFAGPGVFSEEWAAASGATVLFLPRAPFAALSAAGPLSPRERALGRWREGALPADAPAGIPWRRIVAILAEWREREGGASLFPGPWTAGSRSGAASATEMEELARCPYRFFLRYRLKLSPVEEPEETISLSPAEMGIILHDILRIMGRDALEGRGWGDAGKAARKAVSRFVRENPTGLPGLFRLQCRGIERDAAAFAEWERARAFTPGAFRLAAVEAAFEVRDDRVPRAQGCAGAASVAGSGGLPAFRGRVDRIDRGPEDEAEIIDYKYRDGRYEKAPLEWIRHGLSHQIPVYLIFAETLAPPPPSVRASLIFLRRGVKVVTVAGPQWEAVRQDWAAATRDWLAVATAGYFPPLPHHRFRYAGDLPPRYCDACPFKDHCRVSPAFEGTERETEALLPRVDAEPALRPVRDHRPAVER